MPELKLAYICGEPCSGKSTILAKALEGVPYQKLYKLGITYLSHLPLLDVHGQPVPACVTGHQISRALPGEHGTFPGTDTLGMNEQADVCKWLRILKNTGDDQYVVGEGDRLTNDSFFSWVQADGWNLTVIFLDTPQGFLDARREVRARQVGKAQDPKWLAGRATKVKRLGSRYGNLNWWLSGAQPVDVLAARLREHPVIKAIRSGVDVA